MCFLYSWLEPENEKRTSIDTEVAIRHTFSEMHSILKSLKKLMFYEKAFRPEILVNQYTSSEHRDANASIDMNIVYPFMRTNRNQNL